MFHTDTEPIGRMPKLGLPELLLAGLSYWQVGSPKKGRGIYHIPSRAYNIYS